MQTRCRGAEMQRCICPKSSKLRMQSRWCRRVHKCRGVLEVVQRAEVVQVVPQRQCRRGAGAEVLQRC